MNKGEENSHFNPVVKRLSEPSKVAGAIAARVREGSRCAVVAKGSASVFNLLQAVALSRRYLVADGMDITIAPSLINTENQTAEGTIQSVVLRSKIFSYQLDV